MKKIKLNNRTVSLVVLAIIIIGIVIIAIKGLNIGLIYKKNTSISINLGQEFKNEDIKQIAKQVYGDKVIVQKIEIYEDMVKVVVNETTEEQTAQLLNKINEKYGIEKTVENDVIIEKDSNVRLRSIAEECISAVVISFVAIIVYVAVRYRKENCVLRITKFTTIVVGTQLLLISLIAITRIPVGRMTIPIILVIYALSAYVAIGKLKK